MKKIAVLGSSHIHAPGFSDILMNRSDVEVVTVWDPDPAIAQKYASKLNCRSMTEDSSILNMQEIDAVVVMSQTIRHESLALQIAESKKHCYIEKPLGSGQSDAKKIKQALESAGVISFIFNSWTLAFNPPIALIHPKPGSSFRQAIPQR